MPSTLSFEIAGMSCGHCIAAVERALKTVADVTGAAVTIGHADVTLEPSADARRVTTAATIAVAEAGYTMASRSESAPARAGTSCCCATPAPQQIHSHR